MQGESDLPRAVLFADRVLSLTPAGGSPVTLAHDAQGRPETRTSVATET